jgi:hypothetical protein
MSDLQVRGRGRARGLLFLNLASPAVGVAQLAPPTPVVPAAQSAPAPVQGSGGHGRGLVSGLASLTVALPADAQSALTPVSVPGLVFAAAAPPRGGDYSMSRFVGWHGGMPRNILITRWGVVAPKNMKEVVDKFIGNYIRDMRVMCTNVVQPTRKWLEHDDSITAYVEALRSLAAGNQILFIAFLTNNVPKYQRVKQVLINELKKPSQCVLNKTLQLCSSHRGASIVTKIAIQMNGKLGGEPWAVQIDYPGVMFVGMDVFHSGGVNASSTVGFVSSTDSRCTTFFSQVRTTFIAFI